MLGNIARSLLVFGSVAIFSLPSYPNSKITNRGYPKSVSYEEFIENPGYKRAFTKNFLDYANMPFEENNDGRDENSIMPAYNKLDEPNYVELETRFLDLYEKILTNKIEEDRMKGKVPLGVAWYLSLNENQWPYGENKESLEEHRKTKRYFESISKDALKDALEIYVGHYLLGKEIKIEDPKIRKLDKEDVGKVHFDKDITNKLGVKLKMMFPLTKRFGFGMGIKTRGAVDDYLDIFNDFSVDGIWKVDKYYAGFGFRDEYKRLEFGISGDENKAVFNIMGKFSW